MEPERNLVHTILNDWNNTSAPFSDEKCIHEFFEERTASDPDRIALISDDEELTYSELNEKANRLAEVLQTYNIGTGDFVGLLLKRSPELIICLLAILKAGAAYVPLNLTDPENRIMSIIGAAGIKFIITNINHDINLTYKCERLNIEQLIDHSGKIQDIGKTIVIKSTDPAYVIFTSGTTGTPKGVLVNHKSVINIIEWVNKTFEISHNDKLLWITNLSFDLSVYDIFGILAAGGTIRIVSDEDRQDPKKQYDLLLNEGITFWDSAPQSLQQLTPFFNNNGNPDLYHSLRLVFFSGDWIPLSLPTDVTSIFPFAVVVGLGGATEATIWSNFFIIDKILPEWKSIPYGKPIQNARYYILDDKMDHCGIQQAGNLYIGGECLALGYYNDPVLTNSKFIPDPYYKDSKLYLTGDKAQWMADGNIEFLGREDEQIKIRGYRVEMGEIKNAALRNKVIKEAIVLPDKSDRHNIKVILFITTYDNKKLDIKDLKREFRGSLPDYMIPADIVHYDKFPATPNGKIDTKTLLSDYIKSLNDAKTRDLNDNSRRVVHFETAFHEIVYKIWCDVLNSGDIGFNDSFFDLGGQSLSAVQVIARIKERLCLDISLRTFFDNPTINDLCLILSKMDIPKKHKNELIQLADLTNLPLSSNQRRLWVITQFNRMNPAYNIPFTYTLEGKIDFNIFQKSMDLLFNRQLTMFSVFKQKNSEPYCEIIPKPVAVQLIDFSDYPLHIRKESILSFAQEDARKPFDLKEGPLYRLFLLKHDETSYYFHATIHHMIFDGWSWKLFVEEFSSIYNKLILNTDVNLEPLGYQLCDNGSSDGGLAYSMKDEKRLVDFWERTLKESPPQLKFPYDYPRKNLPSGFGGNERIEIPLISAIHLRELSKNENSTLFVTLLSVVGVLFQKYSGENDICIGIPVSCRAHSSLENIIGMFVNTIVVRLKIEENYNFHNLIKYTKNVFLKAIAHQELPFDKIVEAAKPDRISNMNPIFQVSLVWMNNLTTPLAINGVKSERITLSEGVSPFDITIYLWEEGNNIKGEIEYNTDLLTHETIIRLKHNLLKLIDNLIENPDEPIDSIPMITDSEKNQILGFNETRTSYPKDSTIVQLFEEQASIHPDKTAVAFKEESLSYRELNFKTNQLACSLRSMGVDRNAPVGIMAEKSLDVIIGILGILKAGGAYVPIDPEYPDQRINFIIKDSGCKILVTQDKFMNKDFDVTRKISLNSPETYTGRESDIEKINSPSDLAYIMYTSGTTGIPKGSMINQYSVVRLVRNTKYIHISTEDRILLTSAIVFDVATFEIWVALLNGGSLYIADKETILNPKSLGNELIKNDITILWLTSALFTQIAESRTDIFGKLKYLLVGGDVLSAHHINKVRNANPGLKVINGYGPTENTTFSTTYLIEKDFDHNIPIGKPISNSTAYIFDKKMNYQPIGVIGELYVGGDGVSAGYINRDDLNKKSFINHPYIPGERLYRTGDYARWLPDCNIEFHGRVDNQLKIRGFRVELDEIEAVISNIDGVIETVIKPVKGEEGDYSLIAFLNVAETFKMDSKEISRQTKEKLPSYMIPSAYKFIHGFPRTINGKIDKNALIVDAKVLERRESGNIKPLTPTEKIIHNIWSEALKINEISTTDNFFDIGGSSLMAISVFSKIEMALNVEFGLRIFFDSPRIKDLAEKIDITLQKPVGQIPIEKKVKSNLNIVKGEI